MRCTELMLMALSTQLCHGCGGPVRCLTRRISKRGRDDLLDRLRRQWHARGAWSCHAAAHPCLAGMNPFLPAPDRGLGPPA